jgi:transcriptional regulator with XRE-family HTH domain
MGEATLKARDSAAAAARLVVAAPLEEEAGNAPTHDPAARQRIGRRAKPSDVDRYVGRRIRMQRVQVRLTQDRLARLIGVSCQQQHKYERGTSRVSAGRLQAIARALDAEVADFFVGLEGRASDERDDLTPELVRAFLGIRDLRHRQAICLLVRALVDEGAK